MHHTILEALRIFDNGPRTILSSHSVGIPLSSHTAPGIHQHREILFVLEGTCEFPLDYKILHTAPGDTVLIDNWVAHCARYAPQDRNLMHLWINLSGGGIYMWCNRLDNRGERNIIMTGTPLPQEFLLLLNRRWDAWDDLPDEEILSRQDEYMREPLALLLDEIRFQLAHGTVCHPEISDERQLAAVVRKIIESECGKGCSLKYLEQMTGYNRFYIAHVFKRVTGITVGDFIDQVRMHFTEGAKKSGMSRKEIAFALGFASASAFGTWFRKKTGPSVRKR